MDIDHNIIGTHNGIVNYTVGQRKGIGISGSKEPLYVVNIDKDQNSIILGPKEKLKKNVISFKKLIGLVEISLKISLIAPQKLDQHKKIYQEC